MEEILIASAICCFDPKGKFGPISLTGIPGHTIFLQGTQWQCDTLFEVLCGLRRPDQGELRICGKAPYAMTGREAAVFRRDHIGGIPRDGGLLPELPLIDQVAMPLGLEGMDGKRILAEIREGASGLIPLHSLYNLPGQCSPRKRACGAILRAVIRKPRVLTVNGFAEELDDTDRDAFWQALRRALPPDCVFLYLSASPAPEQIVWTRQLIIG